MLAQCQLPTPSWRLRRLRKLAQHVGHPAQPAPALAVALVASSPPLAEQPYAAFAQPAIDVDATQIERIGLTDPLRSLASGAVPAIILRNALPEADCSALLQRCHEAGQIPDSFLPYMPAIDSSTPRVKESLWISPLISSASHGQQASSVYLASRTDIGYSLGTGGNFPNTYWEKCSTVHDMFETLLEPFPPERNPLHIMYDGLHALGARKKTVVTAYEERVRRREIRKGFEVYKFNTQLAGILVLQAPERIAAGGAETGDVYHDAILYNMPATHLPANNLNQATALGLEVTENTGPTSGAFCAANPVASASVDLNVGDMYFFKTDNVHEAPGFGGSKARSVFCTFIGYDEDEDEIHVWS